MKTLALASALALTSSSLAISLSATDTISRWGYALWLLMALQATAGILVVHARLDARIAARKNVPASNQFRRAAFVAIGALLVAAAVAALSARVWITLAMLVAAAGYVFDLREQRNPARLQMSLTTVGKRALTLSCIYAVFLIVGLW